MQIQPMMNKILIIDNDEVFLELLLKLLSNKGWEVIGTNLGHVGLKLAKEQIPDLIICDLRMQALNGYQILKHLREHQHTTTIPIIVYAAALTDKECAQAEKLGASHCIDKFFTLEKFTQLIKSQVEPNYPVALPH
jgi:CheY-like chemotaxis protein